MVHESSDPNPTWSTMAIGRDRMTLGLSGGPRAISRKDPTCALDVYCQASGWSRCTYSSHGHQITLDTRFVFTATNNPFL